MNDDALNMQIRKFLKKVGITSQREIERLVHKAIGNGALNGSETLDVHMTLSISALGMSHQIDGDIALED